MRKCRVIPIMCNYSALAPSINFSPPSGSVSAATLSWQITSLRAKVGGDDKDAVAEAEKELRKTQSLLDEANEAIEELEKFYAQFKKDWGQRKQRTIGYIRSSPAIALNVGLEGFTEDWGTFELDCDKFKDAFRGNCIDLGAFRFISPRLSSPTVTLYAQAPRSRPTSPPRRCIPATTASRPSSTPTIVPSNSAI